MFFEFNFRECLFYAKILKSTIFKEPQFWKALEQNIK